MIIISSDLVLAADPGINLTNPLIGWHNVVVLGGITASLEDADFPASNLANPATNLKWKGTADSPADDTYITIVTGETDEIDYIAVVGHNWGSAAIPVSVEYLDVGFSPPVWTELVQDVLLPDDGPALFRFAPQSISQIRFRLQPGDELPEAAVVYAGKLLVMERSFPAPGQHAPIDFGREVNVVGGMSESGKYLGRIVIGEYTEGAAEFQHLTPAWYRSEFDPFVVAAREFPFFFAWSPSVYPYDVGYAALVNSPKPSVDTVTGRMSVSLQMRGVV